MTSTITHDELLTAYAAGATSPGLSLLCAAHLTLSPAARADVAAYEALGGALLSDEGVGDMAPLSFEAALARIDADEDVEAAPPPPRAASPDQAVDPNGFPRPLLRALSEGAEARSCEVMSSDAISWRFRLPGIHEYVLDGFEEERVSLLKARPGAGVPGHTHEGAEATLVLTGALQDGDQVFRRGDIALNGPEDDHRPKIIGDETCICLIVTDGALRFTGRFGRALNLFAE